MRRRIGAKRGLAFAVVYDKWPLEHVHHFLDFLHIGIKQGQQADDRLGCNAELGRFSDGVVDHADDFPGRQRFRAGNMPHLAKRRFPLSQSDQRRT